MIEKYYRMAGMDFAVSLPRERMYEDDGVLAPFRVQSIAEPELFRFTLAEDLTPPDGDEIAALPGFRVFDCGNEQVRYIGSVEQGWQNAYIRAAHRGKIHDIQLKSRQFAGCVEAKTVLNSFGIEHLVVRSGGVILHASYIEHQGRAILFTAPSGTGKSTQAELWKKHRGADIINGDRAAVRLDNGEFKADGIPFSGSSHYCKNRSLPLAAVVYLTQAPTNSIKKLTGFDAFRKIWEGCSVNTWDRTDVETAMDTVRQLIARVPVYQLDCTPDENAIKLLEQTLNK